MEKRFDSFKQAQVQLDNFVAFYIEERPLDFIFIETHDRKWEGLANSSEEMKRHVAASPFRDKSYFDWP